MVRANGGVGVLLASVAVLGLCGTVATPTANAQTPKSTGKSTTKVEPGKSTGGKSVAGKPTDYTSRFFLLHTDLDPAEAKDLVKRLETMIGLISKYWGKAPQGIIECYVVKNLDNWPPGSLDPIGRAKIAEGAGVTLTETLTLGNQFRAKAVVYAVADRGTPQHEAVHAYCGQNFGTTGPTWYAEGMAEMGQYWVEGERAVTADEEIVKFIRGSKPKGLLEIVDTTAVTGDSWQNYAWRWALCHLLANNPNYAPRFHPLGMGLLTKQEVSFESVYGDVAREISFEYLFFLQHMERGYRVDLCAWDWKKKYRPLVGASPVSALIDAQRGWQGTSVQVTPETEYEYLATGTWKTSKTGEAVNAGGAADGAGKLEGVLFNDFALGEPFDLGASGVWKSTSGGRLYVRCRDPFHELADNSGKVTLKIKLKNEGKPLK